MNEIGSVGKVCTILHTGVYQDVFAKICLENKIILIYVFMLLLKTFIKDILISYFDKYIGNE